MTTKLLNLKDFPWILLDATLVALEPGVEKLCKHKVCCILLACAKPLQYGFGISQHWEALSYFFSCILIYFIFLG